MKTRDLAYIALFAAITAALGLVPAVPVGPVPVTAQTLGIMLAGSVLGARRGFLAILLFLAMVAVGLPLLSSGAGGLAPFFGPSAGYLAAWPFAAGLIGFLTERLWSRLHLGWAVAVNLVGGIALIYAVGVPVTAAIADIPLWVSFTGSFVFLPGDLAKAVIAGVVAVQVRRAYPVIERPRRAAPAS